MKVTLGQPPTPKAPKPKRSSETMLKRSSETMLKSAVRHQPTRLPRSTSGAITTSHSHPQPCTLVLNQSLHVHECHSREYKDQGEREKRRKEQHAKRGKRGENLTRRNIICRVRKCHIRITPSKEQVTSNHIHTESHSRGLFRQPSSIPLGSNVMIVHLPHVKTEFTVPP